MELATLPIFLRAEVDRYGSVRKAAEAFGIEHSYWWRLMDGENDNPSEETLRKLRLRKAAVLYERSDT